MGLNHYKGYCNRWIHVTNTDNGKTVTAKIRDLCESCKDSNRIGMPLYPQFCMTTLIILYLDLSPSAFSQIGAKSKGVLNVKWHYEKAGWSPWSSSQSSITDLFIAFSTLPFNFTTRLIHHVLQCINRRPLLYAAQKQVIHAVWFTNLECPFTYRSRYCISLREPFYVFWADSFEQMPKFLTTHFWHIVTDASSA
jgi:hypothetical protein